MLIQEDRAFLYRHTNSVIVSFLLGVYQEVEPDCPSKLLPEIPRALKLGQVNPVDNLAQIGLIGQSVLLFHVLDIGLVEVYSERVAILDKIQQF